MKITVGDVEYIAKLAKLALTEEEKLKYCKQLSRVLDYMDELNAVDTAAVKSTAHTGRLKNVFREDVAAPSEFAENILKAAPEIEDRYFKVKKVME